MDLALNNLQWLMCHKTKPNLTNLLLTGTVPGWEIFAWPQRWSRHISIKHHFSFLRNIKQVVMWPKDYIYSFCDIPKMKFSWQGREFGLQSRYYVHFRTNTLGKVINSLMPPDMGKNTGTLAQRLECSPMARETWVQSQVESYQRL